MNDRWPQQQRALDESTAAIAAGRNRNCVTSPTGTGKSRMMVDMLEWATERQKRAALFTNRRMLFDQTCRVLESHDVHFGKQAAGHPSAHLRDIQVCMTQSVISRGHKGEPYDLILVDELHNQTGDGLKKIIAEHPGASLVGYTATPLDIDGMVDNLIVAGTTSQGRECGALVAATTYGPDEPDLAVIKKYRVGEDLTDKENSKVMMRPGVFARVLEHWQRLNTKWLPTILFAPDVAGSIYFAEQFTAAGVRTAHIDGKKIWLDGELHDSTPEMRDELARMSKSGELPIVSNRFVLREGIDWPWLQHGILACVFGSLTSYLQSCGRLLRSTPGKDGCIVQDHGGNWWRHSSINADREWTLGMSNTKEVAMRLDRMREKQEPEPIHCPFCHAVRLSGAVCSKCGQASNAKSRIVIQKDGTLKEYRGDIVKPRRVAQRPDTEKLWTQMYFRMKRAGRTFRQAEALFFVENHYYPPRTLPRMPVDDGDWWRKIQDVPFEKLRGEGVNA